MDTTVNDATSLAGSIRMYVVAAPSRTDRALIRVVSSDQTDL